MGSVDPLIDLGGETTFFHHKGPISQNSRQADFISDNGREERWPDVTVKR